MYQSFLPDHSKLSTVQLLCTKKRAVLEPDDLQACKADSSVQWLEDITQAPFVQPDSIWAADRNAFIQFRDK